MTSPLIFRTDQEEEAGAVHTSTELYVWFSGKTRWENVIQEALYCNHYDIRKINGLKIGVL